MFDTLIELTVKCADGELSAWKRRRMPALPPTGMLFVVSDFLNDTEVFCVSWYDIVGLYVVGLETVDSEFSCDVAFAALSVHGWQRGDWSEVRDVLVSTQADAGPDPTPLITLSLPTRAMRVLGCVGIRTVGDLQQCSRSRLLKLKGLGQTTLYEIEQTLAKRNLTLSEY